MSRPAPGRKGGGLLLFALALAGLSALALAADLDGLRQRAQLAAMERDHRLLLRSAERALLEAERELSGIAPAAPPCRGAPCFAAHCPRGYCFHGEYSAAAAVPCRLQPQAPHPQPSAWENAAELRHGSADGRRLLRTIEFRCFLSNAGGEGEGAPLFRTTVRAEDGPRRLTLQSLYSARGRHGWRRLE